MNNGRRDDKDLDEAIKELNKEYERKKEDLPNLVRERIRISRIKGGEVEYLFGCPFCGKVMRGTHFNVVFNNGLKHIMAHYRESYARELNRLRKEFGQRP